MMTPIHPTFQRIIHKEREQELELAIQRRLSREARQASQGTMTAQRAYPWYAQVAAWFKERTALPAVPKQAAAEPAQRNEPCLEIPCS